MDKILIWGIGNISKQIIENGLNGEIIGFIETNRTVNTFKQKKVFEIDEIPKKFDYIIIANSYVNEIYDICLNENLDLNKIIFLKNIKKRVGFTELKTIKTLLGEKNYTTYCSEFGIKEYSFFDEDAKKYEKLNTRTNFALSEQNIWPIFLDKYALAGTINNYFWQDLWAAKLIRKSGVKSHFDIGSRIDGFIAHLLAMEIQVSIIDIREFPGEVDNLYTIIDDATMLNQISDESIESMSALCSLEHFGLGRYGDTVDPEACFKCFDNIQRKLKKGGKLYISLPIGKERVEFNAHRVFYAETVLNCFNTLHLDEFSCTAEGKIEYNVDIHKYDDDPHNGNWRYGLFAFTK